jgi:hypothetical protein
VIDARERRLSRSGYRDSCAKVSLIVRAARCRLLNASFLLFGAAGESFGGATGGEVCPAEVEDFNCERGALCIVLGAGVGKYVPGSGLGGVKVG